MRAFVCPRCRGVVRDAEFYGPCPSCREGLWVWAEQFEALRRFLFWVTGTPLPSPPPDRGAT